MGAKLFPYYAQGARCGHIEGKDRAGQYVIGEEHELADEAGRNQSIKDPLKALEWEKGYKYGYKRAAEGSPLPLSIVNAALP